METPPPPDGHDLFIPDFAPVPLLRKRRNGWTEENQRLFIALLAETGHVGLSARCVGLSARSVYALREKPGAEEFDQAWQEALEIGRTRTRDRLLDRWHHGRLVPVRRRGRITGQRRVYNDRAMIAVLQSVRHEMDGAKDWRPAAQRAMRRDWAAEQRDRAARDKAEAAERARRAAEDAAWLEANAPPPAEPRVRVL